MNEEETYENSAVDELTFAQTAEPETATTGDTATAVNADTEEPAATDVMAKESRREKFFSTKSICTAAMLTAISFVLYAFAKFPLPFMFPGWLEMQFSDLPALIGGFMLGPIWGSLIIVLKCVIKGLVMSHTVGIGELTDIIVGVSFVLPSSLIYMKFRTKKGALLGLGVGSACAVVASLFTNAFISIPMYLKLSNGWQMIEGMMKPLFPNVTRENLLLYYLPLSVLPFNILRCFICALITFFVYKHLHKLINKMFAPRKHKPKVETESAVGEGETALANATEGEQIATLSGEQAAMESGGSGEPEDFTEAMLSVAPDCGQDVDK